jgi:hypothetical protein
MVAPRPSAPLLAGGRPMSGSPARPHDLTKHFPLRAGSSAVQGAVRAVDGVSFTIEPGRTLGCGRRVGLRQVHHGQARPQAGGADRR